MNIQQVVAAMQKIAKDASAALDGEYTTVGIEVCCTHGHETVEFKGYTSPGGHVTRNSLDDVARAILPDKDKIRLELARVREEAKKLESLLGKEMPQ